MKNIRNKILPITIIIFFLIINTSYFWVGKMGLLTFPIFLLLVVIYLTLFVIFIVQFYRVVKEKFKNKFRVFNIGFLAIVLILTFLFPSGFINFERFESKDVLIAQHIGGGNCNTTIKLKEDLTFVKKTVCFGIEKTKGTYHISNDTIYFLKGKGNLEYDYYAVIEELEFHDNLQLFKNKNDTIGCNFNISINDLNSNKQINK